MCVWNLFFYVLNSNNNVKYKYMHKHKFTIWRRVSMVISELVGEKKSDGSCREEVQWRGKKRCK